MFSRLHRFSPRNMDIPTHHLFRFFFISLLCWHSFFLRSEPIFYMCCFIFLFLHLSFSVIFCSVILHVSNFSSCLHLFFFSTLFALFLIFLQIWWTSLSLYFSSSLCWFTNKLSLWVIVLTFSFCLFFPLPFFPMVIFFIFFLLLQCKADDSRKSCGIRSLASGLEVCVILALNNLFVCLD